MAFASRIDLLSVAGLLHGAPAFWARALAFALLMALLWDVARCDARTLHVPRGSTLLLTALGLVLAVLAPFAGLSSADCLSGGFLFFLILLLYRCGCGAFLGREALGLGDVKLAFAAGLFIGWEGVPWVMLLSAPCALACRFLIARARRRRGRKAPRVFAFAPGLCLALAIVAAMDAFGLSVGPLGPAAWAAWIAG